MSEKINHSRRRLLSAAAVTIAASPFSMIGIAKAFSRRTKSVYPYDINVQQTTLTTLLLPNEGYFPSLSGATAWLNSPPLTPVGLHGKVVLVDFCTYSCIN